MDAHGIDEYDTKVTSRRKG